MGDLKENTKNLGDLIEKGERNKGGLIGAICLSVIAFAGYCVKSIIETAKK